MHGNEISGTGSIGQSEVDAYNPRAKLFTLFWVFFSRSYKPDQGYQLLTGVGAVV